ncbi:MAG: Gfo/Idh/MocA family oxidoreductase [Candidatus Bathyarchaeia archaeon]
MDKVRVGVIGAGAHANFAHYPSLASMRDVEIVAISDLNEERLNKTADKYGVIGRYKDFREMIDKERLDAVYIIVPPHQLYDLAIFCLKKRLNVFVEKPPGITYEQNRNMALTAKKYGCKTMVGFNRRFIPLMRKVRAIVEERGPIIQCAATFYKSMVGAWLPYYEGAVDILTCDAIHAVDTLRWMGGEVETVASLINQFYAEYNNSFNALIKFKGGTVGFLMTNWAVGKRIHTFEMHSRGISAFINPDDKAVIYADNCEEPIATITAAEAAGSQDRVKYYGFYDENRHFIDRIKEDKEPETNFEDAAKTMELINKIYNSQIQ